MKYQIVIKVSVFAPSQGAAVTELESRLQTRPLVASQDPFAVVIDEVSAKRTPLGLKNGYLSSGDWEGTR